MKQVRRAVLGFLAAFAVALPAGATPFTSTSGDAAVIGGGFASENVEWVSVLPQHSGTAGGTLLGKYYYLTDPRGVYIYDVSDPASPVLTGSLTGLQLGTGSVLAQEDPDTNGKILLVNAYEPGSAPSTSSLLVVDVKDKTAPVVAGTLNVSAHTWTCILKCKYAIGRDGHILDLRDPTKPERIGDWRQIVSFTSYVHDFEEVSNGRVVASGQPSLYMDFKKPLAPKVLAVLESEFPSLGYHGAQWPRGAKDRLLLMGAEVVASGATNTAGSDCTDESVHAVATYDTKAVAKATKRKSRFTSQSFKKLDEWRVGGRGAYADGNAPAHTLYCGHWFDAHPKWKNGGTLALGHYDWGTRFLKVSSKGAMEEIGYFQPVRGYTASVRWITNDIVYVHDYIRGVDILRVSGK